VKTVRLGACVVVAVFFISGSSGARELASLKGPADWNRWTAEEEWQWNGNWVGGTGTGSWAYAETGSPDWADYQVELSLRIAEASARREPKWEGGRGAWTFASYRNNADLGGYEAALLLRKSGDDFYRVMFSVPYQEVLLWSSTGGILQVSPFSVNEGQELKIRARAQGAHLVVEVNGQAIIDYWDRAAPLMTGAVALGLRDGKAHFSNVMVSSLAAGGPPPAHRPDFRFRDWKGGRWAWDAGEPLFLVAGDCNGYEVKLVRGYRPQLYIFWHWLNYGAETFYASKLKEIKVNEEGRRLRFEVISTDRGEKTWLTSRTEVTVTYDKAQNRYVYDHVSDLIIPEGHSLQVTHPLEFTDPAMHGAVGSASTYGPQWETPHPWSVYKHVSGRLYKQPHNHCGWYPGYGKPAWREAKSNYLHPQEGFWAMVGDPVANPVLYVLGSSVADARFYSELCGWAYDLHMRWIPCKRGERIGPGTYTVKWRMTSVDGEQGDRWLKQAGWCAPGDLEKKLLLYTGGVGHVERFDKVVKLASPFSEHAWGGAELQDTTIGHGDNSSLRLDGPRSAASFCGGSHYTEPFQKDTVYEISVWVRTKDVQGEGPGIIFSGKPYFPGITGTRDWQRIGFVTEPAPPLHSVYFELRHSGSGTVWFDDFLIRPLEEGEKAAPPIASAPKPIASPKETADRLLEWNAQGEVRDTGRTVLDLSGHGNHGRLEGSATWVDEAGSRVMEFDGESAYVEGGYLDFKGPKTLSVWVKPGKLQHDWNMIATGGPWNRAWWLFLYYRQSPYSIDFRPRGGRMFLPKAIPEGEWSHIAVTDDGKMLRIYVNGEKVKEDEIGRDWSVGSGPLRLGTRIDYGEPKSGFTGRIAGCTYWNRALGEAEMKRLFQAGLPAARK